MTLKYFYKGNKHSDITFVDKHIILETDSLLKNPLCCVLSLYALVYKNTQKFLYNYIG